MEKLDSLFRSAAGPLSRTGLGCGGFPEVLDYFDLTPEQRAYPEVGEPLLPRGDSVAEGIAKGRERAGVGGEPGGAARRAGATHE